MCQVRRPLIQLGLLCLLGIAGRAGAQIGYTVEPFAGYYRPLGHFDPAMIIATNLPQTPSGLSGFLWGANAQITSAGRIALEGAVSTAASTLPACACPNGFDTGPTHLRVTVASVVGQYDISNDRDRYHLWVNAGPAVVHREGGGYDQFGSPTSWGGAFGLELAVSVARQLQVVATGSGVAYSLNMALQRGQQFDVLASIGVRWHPGS
jgi:hypothetical protein